MSDNKRNNKEESDSSGQKPAEKPVSLRPLKFEEAVRGLLKTKPAGSKIHKRQSKGRGNG